MFAIPYLEGCLNVIPPEKFKKAIIQNCDPNKPTSPGDQPTELMAWCCGYRTTQCLF